MEVGYIDDLLSQCNHICTITFILLDVQLWQEKKADKCLVLAHPAHYLPDKSRYFITLTQKSGLCGGQSRTGKGPSPNWCHKVENALLLEI